MGITPLLPRALCPNALLKQGLTYTLKINSYLTHMYPELAYHIGLCIVSFFMLKLLYIVFNHWYHAQSLLRAAHDEGRQALMLHKRRVPQWCAPGRGDLEL